MQKVVLPRFNLLPPKNNPPDVVLIERGHARHGFEDHSDLPKDIRATGIQRRCISNHAELVATLTERYGNRFRNVVLEGLPLAEQILLFHHARLIIGQHGAGLNNLIWMKSDAGTVIELAPSKIMTFKNLCLAKGLNFRTIRSINQSNAEIDLAELHSLLDEFDENLKENVAQ